MLSLVFLAWQGKYDEAQPLYERAIVIWEASLGSDHAQVATGLSDLAGTLYAQVQAIRKLQDTWFGAFVV